MRILPLLFSQLLTTMNNKKGSFNTERLSIAPWDRTDPELLKDLDKHLNEDVTAFLPEFLVYQKGKSKASEWAESFESGSSEVSTVKLDNEFAGLLMLREEAKDTMHIGYIFGQAYWGKGLATELIKGLVSRLKEIEYRGTLHGGVVKGNPASVRVLQKAGFEEMGKGELEGKPDDVDWFKLSF